VKQFRRARGRAQCRGTGCAKKRLTLLGALPIMGATAEVAELVDALA
jgi:hypothetical protein